ncbi:MAG TPA: M20/M25/M40 family metallo-hydrolase [Coriobacteriia bacterium]|nr:M20/M25/M40 family metallo-hydrolase [Coriobacteriia bacterium]
MRKIRRSLSAVLVLILCMTLVVPVAVAAPPLMPNAFGQKAYSHLLDLSSTKRIAASEAELAAATKIDGWFEGMGYTSELQPFTYVRRGTTYSSQNVVAYREATKKSKETTTPLVILGAHYDNVAAGFGADDNASGVATMLEIAERIARYQTEYDIAFVAFGAEEVGLRGSAYYAGQLSEADRARTIVMINFDSLIVGDKLYIHAGANEKTWARDEMLGLIERRKLPIEMQPGLNPDYPAGYTPDGFSDYTAFNQAGIPIVAFESTNWEIGDLDGYEQTEEFGSFWHTPNDNLSIIESMLPGRPLVRLHAYTKLVFEFLKHLNPDVEMRDVVG